MKLRRLALVGAVVVIVVIFVLYSKLGGVFVVGDTGSVLVSNRGLISQIIKPDIQFLTIRVHNTVPSKDQLSIWQPLNGPSDDNVVFGCNWSKRNAVWNMDFYVNEDMYRKQKTLIDIGGKLNKGGEYCLFRLKLEVSGKTLSASDVGQMVKNFDSTNNGQRVLEFR